MVLSVSDHHLQEVEIVTMVTAKGLFKLLAKEESTYSFTKTD
jgi:hypothetical protein